MIQPGIEPATSCIRYCIFGTVTFRSSAADVLFIENGHFPVVCCRFVVYLQRLLSIFLQFCSIIVVYWETGTFHSSVAGLLYICIGYFPFFCSSAQDLLYIGKQVLFIRLLQFRCILGTVKVASVG